MIRLMYLSSLRRPSIAIINSFRALSSAPANELKMAPSVTQVVHSNASAANNGAKAVQGSYKTNQNVNDNMKANPIFRNPAKIDFQKQSKDHIKNLMYNGSLPRSNGQILDAMYVARRENVTLDMKDYELCINAAAQFRGQSSDIAFVVYDLLKYEGSVLPEMYPKLMTICLHRNNAKRAVEITRDVVDRDLVMSEQFMCSLLTVLAASGLEENKSMVEFYYKAYRNLIKDKGFRSTPSTYTLLATYFCRLNDGEMTIKILRDMNDEDHEPSPILCAQILDAALFVSQAEVLQILASWYANNFDITLDNGVISRMLQIAATNADARLAQSTFEIMAKNGRTPTVAHFACYIRATLASGDYIGGIAALQEMESMGLSFQSQIAPLPANPSVDPENVSDRSTALCCIGQYESIKTILLKSILDTVGADKIDELYYTLIDQVNQGRNIPRLVLDVIVEAFGRLDLTERSFEVFQDYKMVFNAIPDINSYNSLLASCACARVINIRTILTVFQEIETPSEMNNMIPNKPNGKSFSILLEAISDNANFENLDEILNYMIELKVNPSLRSLRKLMVVLAKKNQLALLDRVTSILIEQQEGRELPLFLRNRINQIKANLPAPTPATTTEVTSKVEQGSNL